MPREIILDCDVGIDDALAVILALRSPELKLRAITTVSGNVHVEKTSRNALKVLEFLNRPDIPVARGASKPLVRELITGEHVHGNDGLGDSQIPDAKLSLDPRNAVDLILEETQSTRGLTIVATGPLTNIALALTRNPDFARRIDKIVMMGGVYGVTQYGYGNVTPVAEYNVFADPEAAQRVLNSGARIQCVGLDVTTDPNAVVNGALYSKITGISSANTRFFERITKSLMQKRGILALHDPMAVAIAADASLAQFRSYNVQVETVGKLCRGQTVADRRKPSAEVKVGEPNAEICVGVDGARFLGLFVERVIEK